MVKKKNPGFLSKDERTYLGSLERGSDPRRRVSNPSRVKSRILEFQKDLPKAIESIVEDVRSMHFTPEHYSPNEMIRKFSPKEVESEFTRALSAKRIGYLKFHYLDSPLDYLLIVTLEALTRKADDQKQAILEILGRCLALASHTESRVREHPRFKEVANFQKEAVELLGALFEGVGDELGEGREDADWLISHSREQEVLLTVFLESQTTFEDEIESDKRRIWVHRDKISDVIDLERRTITRTLTILEKRGLVEKDGHRYHTTEAGEVAVVYLFTSTPHLRTFL
jgi:DNA-binding transcriptional ArsR family regulator